MKTTILRPQGLAGDKLNTVIETAERLRVSRSFVYKLFDGGQLGSVKVGRRRMVKDSQIADYIASLTDGAA